MTKQQYQNLKIGDKVKTQQIRSTYHRQIVDSGEIGTVAAIQCPSVCRENVTFACIDFSKVNRVALVSNKLTGWTLV